MITLVDKPNITFPDICTVLTFPAIRTTDRPNLALSLPIHQDNPCLALSLIFDRHARPNFV